MKKTLLGLVVAIVTFGVGNFAYNLLFFRPEPVTPAAFGLRNISETEKRDHKIKDKDATTCGFDSLKNRHFSVTEGDYDSQQNKRIWMYLFSNPDLYSTSEGLKNFVDGYVMVNSKTYDLRPGGKLDPNTGEIRFETKKIKQVSYIFTGTVTQKDYSEEEIVLRGKLEKVKNGTVVKTENHKFKFYYHHCSQ